MTVNNFQFSIFNFQKKRGYTLVELIVAVGLFAIIMTLASGAYIVMIDITRQAQDKATGINNLSFALETMTRNIRTGTNYNCNGSGDCNGAGSFSFADPNGETITYSISGSTIWQKKGSNAPSVLTDPLSVNISSLLFHVSGTAPLSAGNHAQPYVTITVSGSVSSGPGKALQSFAVETGAAMRGSDL